MSFGLVTIPVQLYSAPPRRRTSPSTRYGAATAAGSGTSGWLRPTARRCPTPRSPRASSSPPARPSCSPTRTSPTCRWRPRRPSRSCSSSRSTEVDPIYFAKSYYLEPDRSASSRTSCCARRWRTPAGSPRQGGPAPARDARHAARPGRRPRAGDDALAGRDPRAGLRVPRARTSTSSRRRWRWRESLIEALSGEFDPTQYTDALPRGAQALIDAKVEGREVVDGDEEAPTQGPSST